MRTVSLPTTAGHLKNDRNIENMDGTSVVLMKPYTQNQEKHLLILNWTAVT